MVITAEGYVNCVNSFNGRSYGVAQCNTNYCKKYTGSSGIVSFLFSYKQFHKHTALIIFQVQLSCDDTGDCQRSFERTFIGPVQVTQYFCNLSILFNCRCTLACPTNPHAKLAAATMTFVTVLQVLVVFI